MFFHLLYNLSVHRQRFIDNTSSGLFDPSRVSWRWFINPIVFLFWLDCGLRGRFFGIWSLVFGLKQSSFLFCQKPIAHSHTPLPITICLLQL